MSDTGAFNGVDVLRALSNRHDPSTESYGMRLLRDAIAGGDTLLILDIYIIMARFYTNALGNIPKAMEYANLAEKIASENKVSLHTRADICLMIAAIYKLMAQYHKGIQRCDEGIGYLKSISAPTPEDSRLLYEAYLNLGMLQLVLGLKKLGVASVQQALKMAVGLGDRTGIVRCKITLAKNFVAQKRFHDALAIYIEIEPDEALLGSDDNRAIFRDYIGQTYMEVGMYEESERYLLESLAIRRKGLQPVKQIHPLDALARLLFRQGMIEKGDVYMKEALTLADQYDAYFTKRVKAAMKFELYRDRGDHAIAQKYMADIELSNVDAEAIERTIESMMDTERNKQQVVQEEAAMLKALNDEMQSHTRQLEDVNTDLQSYARTASHDLREPLRMISTYMTILSQKIHDKLTEDEQKFMHFAVDGAQRMDDMITRILSAAKSQDATLRPVDLNRIAAQTIQNLTNLIKDKNAIVTHDPLPMVLGDDIQLLQVIQNIVTNAIKYNQSPQPAVHISFLKDHELCVVSIADNGVGIAESERENVFKMYQRVENKTGEDGTGIGLFTVKRNIERMKGRIWIEGNHPNGSIFKIELPAAI